MSAKNADDEPEQLAARRAALAGLDELHDAAERMLDAFGPDVAARPDVVWLDLPADPEARRPPTLRVAPLAVGGLLAERLFGRRTVALTSATLSVGGSFDPLARQWGLPPTDVSAAVIRPPAPPAPAPGLAPPPAASETVEADAAVPGEAVPDAPDQDDAETGGEVPDAERPENADREPAEPHPLTWSGIDVGSPFDHPRSGILYVARHLPPPGRDGLAQAYLDEIAELIEAAGGRTLGLFSSMRAAKQAAAELRDRIGYPLMCQGEDPTSQLISRFAEDEASCLFGTLSLWQGVDVPGRSLQLVVIDRIPFPRPDDPLASARQRAVEAGGGNGFMTVAAAQAALLLAQGTGRLLRTMEDRGVVAILDPRLVTKRYGGFLRASLPPFWNTTDPEVVRGALRRLSAQPDAQA
jgi:ATP-dependent DNA helicase DinG